MLILSPFKVVNRTWYPKSSVCCFSWPTHYSPCAHFPAPPNSTQHPAHMIPSEQTNIAHTQAALLQLSATFIQLFSPLSLSHQPFIYSTCYSKVMYHELSLKIQWWMVTKIDADFALVNLTVEWEDVNQGAMLVVDMFVLVWRAWNIYKDPLLWFRSYQ